MTTETQTHTPGPWLEFEVKANGRAVIRTGEPSHRFIAEVGSGPHGAADARLIASAPDLLSALEDARGHLSDLLEEQTSTWERIEATIADLDAAIRRARGQ